MATIIGTTGADLRNGSNDLIWGLDGNDTLNASGGSAHGGTGNDQIFLTLNFGINPDGTPAFGYGGEGDDLINANNSFGALFGDEGADTIFGGSGNIQAPTGQTISGGDGADAIFANGKANIYGGLGNDSIYGGAQNDTLIGDHGLDLLVGNAGDDWLYLPAGGGSAFGGLGNDTGIGSQVNDVFVMNEGNDVAYGYNGNDYFYGFAGNDTFYGGDGVDVLIGGEADDWLDGGEGVNYYFGGNGSGPGTSLGTNTYVVRDIPGVQVVQDFTAGLDIVRFEGSGFTGFADIVARSSQNGAYLVVSVDGDTAVWLNGASLDTITSASFLIVS